MQGHANGHRRRRRHAVARPWIWLAALAALMLLAAACEADPDDELVEDPEAEADESDEDDPEDDPDDDPDDEPDDEDDEDDEPDEEDEPDPDDDAITIGVVSALEGPFADGAEDGGRAIEMAIDDFDGEVAGRPIETSIESSDTSADTAVERSRQLVEQEEVDLMFGPLSGTEGVAISEYAETVPDMTFIDAASGGIPSTLEGPDNYFRFTAEGSQQGGNIGTYAYEELGYERMATLGEDYDFPHALVGSFIEDFCTAGGEVVEAFWVPLGESDYSSVIASIPEDVDAIYGGIGGSDAVNFLEQSIEFGIDVPIVGGSILVDETVLAAEGADLREAVTDIVASAPVHPNPDDELWVEWSERYHDMFPDEGFDEPSLFAALYYNNFRSLLEAVESVDGDLDDRDALHEALRDLEWEGPIGPVGPLNENNQGSVRNFIFEIAEGEGEELDTELRQVDDGIEPAEEVYERMDGCP
ncbi:ABC transporter substrate-binding protein [Egibacter rhizosphaerae]|uniref:ABC transporter substrate-binding protein n=1 Tax=Egibacter rhizosphaerae TaxID=1670831 RepID=A0A411YJQ7_9ACTN|nr:ABC transporter substrate-binding protein [Egibacter rhizosphaerae]QBI21430.1 ABC transporter substrate-binding protein [Egibacter rhizosphaerae]